jgi:hypothetical protein
MRALSTLIVATGMLAAYPAGGEALKLAVTARGLPPDAQVWLEVTPEYHEIGVPKPGDSGSGESRPAVAAEAGRKFEWRLKVSGNGDLAPASHDFIFPATVDWKSAAHDRTVRAIFLKTRFRIDPQGSSITPGYGEVHEVTLGMSIPSGATTVSRCLRLRSEDGRFAVENAADCSEASFARAAGQGTMHVRLQMPPGR